MRSSITTLGDSAKLASPTDTDARAAAEAGYECRALLLKGDV